MERTPLLTSIELSPSEIYCISTYESNSCQLLPQQHINNATNTIIINMRQNWIARSFDFYLIIYVSNIRLLLILQL